MADAVPEKVDEEDPEVEAEQLGDELPVAEALEDCVWLELALEVGDADVDEVGVAERLEELEPEGEADELADCVWVELPLDEVEPDADEVGVAVRLAVLELEGEADELAD